MASCRLPQQELLPILFVNRSTSRNGNELWLPRGKDMSSPHPAKCALKCQGLAEAGGLIAICGPDLKRPRVVSLMYSISDLRRCKVLEEKMSSQGSLKGNSQTTIIASVLKPSQAFKNQCLSLGSDPLERCCFGCRDHVCSRITWTKQNKGHLQTP